MLVLALAGLTIALLFRGPPPTGDAIHRAFARARAYYRNQTNADCRRARMELEAVGDRLGTSAAFHVNLALIDLSEFNHRIQGESRLLPGSGGQRLLRSARDHLTHARALGLTRDALAFNLARTYLKMAPSAENRDELQRLAEGLLSPLTAKPLPDPATLLLLGNLLWERGDREAAGRHFVRIAELAARDRIPGPIHFVALNRLVQLQQRTDPDAAAERRRKIDELFPEKPEPTPAALERGRYTVLLEITDPPATTRRPADVSWVRATEGTRLPQPGPEGHLIAPDIDGDCARDLVLAVAGHLRVFRNRGNAVFDDLTEQAGLPGSFRVRAAAAGDIDHNGLCDLVVGGPDGLAVFLNHTDFAEPARWRFMPAPPPPSGPPHFGAGAALAVSCLLLGDLDHDGDLDLFVGGPESNRLYRLEIELPVDGGKYLRFADVTELAGVAEPPATEALLLDVEDDHDVDLLVAGPQGNAWFENRRRMRFERRALPEGATLGAGDADNDLREEVRVGRGVYRWRPGGWDRLFERDALADFDGDGVLDTDPLAGVPVAGAIRRVVATDLNRDGSCDLILHAGGRLDVFLAAPGRAVAWIDVRLRGRGPNTLGIGTRLQLFAGDLRIGATSRDGLVSFGLGQRPVVDALLVRWPDGVEQGVVTPRTAGCVVVGEREDEAGS